MRWRARAPLRHHRLQTILTVAAIATAVSLPVVLLSVGGGVFQHELAQLQNAGYEIVVSASGVHAVDQSHSLAASIDRVGSVTAASPVLSFALDAFVGPGGGAQPVLVEGVIPQAFEATEGPTERSVLPSPLPLGDPTDLVHYRGGSYRGVASWDVMVSTPFMQSSGSGTGTSLILSPDSNRSGGVAFNVTGVFGVPPTTLGPTAAYAMVVPLSDLQVLAGLGAARTSGDPPLDAADTIEVALDGAAAADPSQIDRAASEIQGLVPFYGVTSLTQEAQHLQEANSVLTGFYLALSSVALAVGLIFLALVLVRRVESERKSIGIQRAMGVPGRFIASGIVRTGLLLSGGGAVVGVGAGIILVRLLQVYGSPEVQAAANLAVFDPRTLILLGAGVVGLSSLASALASRTALRLSIPEALR
ncbi:MAG: FtsX-like permease family protein [Thermoplasmata archaeon]|nr:FtsX-like permease family protein [Thermoplasmata archaeon]